GALLRARRSLPTSSRRQRRCPAPAAAIAALVFAFLYAMIDIFKGYFEEDFDEDSIRDNLCVQLARSRVTCSQRRQCIRRPVPHPPCAPAARSCTSCWTRS